MVLMIVTMLHIKYLDFILLHNYNRISFHQCLPSRGNHIILSISMHLTFLDSTYKWDYAGFYSFCIQLISLGIISSMLLQMAECPFIKAK